MKEFLQLKIFIEENDTFFLIGHENADGDCYGTMVAFHNILTKLNKKTELIFADPIPDNYRFLFKKTNPIISHNISLNNKSNIIFECNNYERTGIKLSEIGKTANFDHHPDNDNYGNINIVDKTASSVGEMATFFINKFYKHYFDKDIANSLYTAIHTDTGGFAYSNTSKKTFEACSILMEHNLDSSYVYTKVYENKPIQKLKLMGFYLENLKLIKNGVVSYGLIMKENLDHFGCQKNDTENFGGIARAVKGAEIGIFLLEIEKNTYKLSLRSKGKYIVNEVAKAFGGGGHKFAAGCIITGNPQNIIEKVADSILNG